MLPVWQLEGQVGRAARARRRVLGARFGLDPDRIAITRQHRGQRQAVGQGPPHRRRRADGEALPLTQEEQAERVVEVGVGQQHAVDRRIANRAWLSGQRWKLFGLKEQIGRGVQQKPRRAVGADGDAGLRARMRTRGVAARDCADAAVAVPLRKAAAGGGAQETDADGCILSSIPTVNLTERVVRGN